MDKTKLIIGIVIAALIIFSVVQVVQISSARAELKQQLGYGQVSAGVPVSGSPAPSVAQNAYPAMVGGC